MANNNKFYKNREDKSPIKFDAQTLLYFGRYVLSENEAIHVGGLTNLRKLMRTVDPEIYATEPNNKELYNFILDALNSRIVKNYNKREYIILDVQGVMGTKYPSVIPDSFPELSKIDVAWIEQSVIVPLLQSSSVFSIADQLKKASNELLMADPSTVMDKANNLINAVKNSTTIIRRNEIESDDNNTLDLSDPDATVTRIVDELKNPSHILKTGMQSVNTILGGGFEGGRVYCLFGLPGEGKSTVLKNLAVQIKKNNKGYECNDKTKKPIILYLTMENQVTEEFSTLINIAGYSNDIKKSKDGAKEILEYMRTSPLHVDTDNDINIIMKYRPINSIDTNAIYTMIEDEADKGNEVIAVVQDYLKRIKPVNGNSLDERFRLGNIVNEFKNCAIYYNIPIITASQLNREAARKVDEARKNQNWDSTLEDVGRGDIGESSLIDENLDASIIIVPCELDNKKFMGFKLTKNRYRADIPVSAKRFYQPFADDSKVRLQEDLHCFRPASKYSLLQGELSNIDNDTDTEEEEFTSILDENQSPIDSLQNSSIESYRKSEVKNNSDNNPIEPIIFYDEDELSKEKIEAMKREIKKDIARMH